MSKKIFLDENISLFLKKVKILFSNYELTETAASLLNVVKLIFVAYFTSWRNKLACLTLSKISSLPNLCE